MTRTRTFQVLFVGQGLSTLGRAFSFVAVPLLVLEATGSVVQMGMLKACAGIASFLATMASSAIVDRVDNLRIMKWCDYVCALLVASIPVTWAFFGPRVGLLYVVTAGSTFVSGALGVAFASIVPRIVPKSDITKANSQLGMTNAVCFVAGPALAGLVASRWGAATAVALDAVTFAASAVSLSFLSMPKGAGEAARPHDDTRVTAGAIFVARHAALRALVLLTTCELFATSAITEVFIFRLKHDLSQGDRSVGLALAVGALGAVVGAATTPSLEHRAGFGTTFASMGVVMALSLFGAAHFELPWAAISAATMFTLANSARSVLTVSFRQKATPDGLLGRVTSAFWTLQAAAMAAGAAMAGVVAERFGAPSVFVSAGVVMVLVAIVGALSLRSNARGVENESAL